VKFLSGQISTHTERHTHQHWARTAPQVMIVAGTAREMLCAYRRDLDVKIQGCRQFDPAPVGRLARRGRHKCVRRILTTARHGAR
jgi:hypothetical protein